MSFTGGCDASGSLAMIMSRNTYSLSQRHGWASAYSASPTPKIECQHHGRDDTFIHPKIGRQHHGGGGPLAGQHPARVRHLKFCQIQSLLVVWECGT